MSDREDRIEQLDSPRKDIVEHLEDNGWNVIVVGKQGVRDNKPSKKQEYVLEFTGAKKENSEEVDEA